MRGACAFVIILAGEESWNLGHGYQGLTGFGWIELGGLFLSTCFFLTGGRSSSLLSSFIGHMMWLKRRGLHTVAVLGGQLSFCLDQFPELR